MIWVYSPGHELTKRVSRKKSRFGENNELNRDGTNGLLMYYQDWLPQFEPEQEWPTSKRAVRDVRLAANGSRVRTLSTSVDDEQEDCVDFDPA